MDTIIVPRAAQEFMHASEEPMGLLAWSEATDAERQAPRPVNVCRTRFPEPWCTCLTYQLRWEP